MASTAGGTSFLQAKQPKQANRPPAWIPFFHVFLLASKSQTAAILIDFAAPATFLVLQNLQGIMAGKSLSDTELPGAVAALVAYTLLTSAVNLIVFQLVSLRESGELRSMAHAAGSVRPVVLALVVSQTLIATAEATVLALLAMLVARRWSLPVLLAVLIASPIAMLLLSGFFLPTLRLHLTPGGLTAILSLVILVLLALPSALLPGGPASAGGPAASGAEQTLGRALTPVGDLNPYQLAISLIVLLTGAFGGPAPATNLTGALISLGLGIALCVLLGAVGLGRPLLAPIERRR